VNTINAQQAVERFISVLPAGDHRPGRDRLSRMLRYVISQRLVPRKQDEHRTAVFEVWKSGPESLEKLLRHNAHPRDEDSQGHSPERQPEHNDDWSIDSQIEDLVRSGIVHPEIAVTHAMDPGALAKKLGLTE
jgi:Tfp pilus assembly pilus retraction ATPase PilT